MKIEEPDYNIKSMELLEYLPEPYAYNRIVNDGQGQPIDYIFLHVNPAFEGISGKKRDAVIGKKATEVLPWIGKGEINWINVLAQVSLAGKSIRFEQYLQHLKEKNCLRVRFKTL